MLPNTSRLQVFYLSYLSQPAHSRPIYRAICRQRVRSILELGIGIGQRAMRMIEVAGCFRPTSEIRFTGLDLFEARAAVDGPGVTLKMAHRLLKATGARIQLVPGDPVRGLSQVANALGKVDVIVVSSRLDPRQLARAWFYVPRLLHGQSQVFIETLVPGGGVSVRSVTRSKIDTLAAAAAAAVAGRRAA